MQASLGNPTHSSKRKIALAKKNKLEKAGEGFMIIKSSVVSYKRILLGNSFMILGFSLQILASFNTAVKAETESK